MRTLPLAGIIAALLFIGVFAVSYSEELADHVVINEIDTNPPGDDSKTVSEWVELYNPTDKDVNIGGWKIASTTVTKKTLTLPVSTVIKPGQFLVYSYQSLWFTDVSEKVQLKDKEGTVIDETQVITDQKNDYQSWQRKFDGVISESNSWIFRGSTPGSTNGKLMGSGSQSTELAVSIKSDKKSYIFGETAVISGNVSKRVYQEKPTYIQQQLIINIDGPGTFHKLVTIYPDLNLQYKTLVKLDKVQGVTAGQYKIDVKYGDATDYNAFSVGEQLQEAQVEQKSVLQISTDKETYIPGQTVKFTVTTDSIIPGEGLKYVVYDANGIQIFTGKLFPNQYGEFSGNVFMTPTKPAYGTLDIVADYGDQHATASFDLAKDDKDTQKIIIVTDKDAYAPGETVVVSGRSNKFVTALDLSVVQTGTSYLGGSHRESTDKVGNIFKVNDQVKLAGDSSFRYELKIPEGAVNLGDYKVTVSKEFGQASTYFKIVENPEDYVATAKYYIKTDQNEYAPADTILVTGHVDLAERSTLQAIPVKISLLDDKGKQISIAVGISSKQLVQDKVSGKTATYSFTSIPDAAGNFKLDFAVNPAAFSPGVYTIRGSYEKHLFDTKFAVMSGLDTKDKGIYAKTDKDVYGLGETVFLDGVLSSGQSAVKITLTDPNGKTINEGAKIDKSRFTWSWQAPLKEYGMADIRDPRAPRPSVFGVYKISISATSQTVDVFFKLSANPESDTLEIKPLDVKTDKAVYRAGEKMTVSGAAIKRQGATANVGTVSDRVNLEVKTMTNKVLYTSGLATDNGGGFTTTYDLPLTIFKEGKYKVVASYQKLRVETMFEIKNDIPTNAGGKTVLTVSTDKEQYLVGDTVHITGSANKVIFLSTLDLVVNHKKDNSIDCGKFYCGLGGKQIDIARSYLNGVYSYDYKIPSSSALGTYEVIVDTDFGTFTTTFDVVEKLTKKAVGTSTISEKFNRISDPTVEVGLFEQTNNETVIAPSTVQGSLIVPRGSEKTTNLTILADDGTCMIGQAKECLVSGPTKDKGLAYKTITAAGMMYKVTYSGSDQVLEKFSITPQSSDDVIPDSTWTIKVDNHVPAAKLYYEIVYKQIQ